MNNIIEKLGIAPIKWIDPHGIKPSECKMYCALTIPDFHRFKYQYNEMLEALIEITDKIISGNYTVCLDRTSDNIEIIEKATGKSWKEIKELLNE